MAKEMTAREKRCEDCAECLRKNGKMLCHEMWDAECQSVEECPLDIECEEVEEINEKAKDIKVQHGASAEDKKKRKAPERKPDEEKIKLIADLAEFLGDYDVENVEITNKSKIIEFDLGESHYKLDLSRKNKNLAKKKAEKA